MTRRIGARVLALACIPALLVCGILAACTWLFTEPGKREPPVDMRELVVEASAFPLGWEPSDSFEDPRPIPEKALVEDYSAEQGFYRRLVARGVRIPSGVTAWHRVLEYRNEWQAMASFYLNGTGAFYAFSRLTPYAEPEGWSYRSPISDHFLFGCADFETHVGVETICVALARYGQFVSVFETDMHPEAMTLDDVERLLRSIDERMESQLNTNHE